ncbi:MAG: hypothetical protein JNM51_11530 [Bacteroidia bacterium]|nr:hypothetical protein [Bacteroidia bacterium]
MPHSLTLSYEFNLDTNLVYEYFLDLRKYGSYHPVMTSVNIVLDNTPEYVEYEINEEVKLFGLIKIYPNYKAKVFELEKGRHIQYTSQVKSKLFLTIDIYINPHNNKTMVTENINVTGNRIITAIFLRILQKTHLSLFDNMHHNKKV